MEGERGGIGDGDGDEDGKKEEEKGRKTELKGSVEGNGKRGMANQRRGRSRLHRPMMQ